MFKIQRFVGYGSGWQEDDRDPKAKLQVFGEASDVALSKFSERSEEEEFVFGDVKRRGRLCSTRGVRLEDARGDDDERKDEEAQRTLV